MEKLETKRGAISFLDVLGWKGIWAKDADAIQTFKKLFDFATNERDRLLQDAYTVYPHLRGKQQDDLLRIISISDTIVIISICDIQESLWLTAELLKKLMPFSIRRNMPMRGATTYGNFNFDFSGNTNLLVGPAVDEAASWHEATNWIGVHLTPSTQMLLVKEDFNQERNWVLYDGIPFKSGKIEDSYALNWFPEWVLSSSSVQGEFSELNVTFEQNGPMTPEIAKYYLSALRFCKFCMNSGFFILAKTKKASTTIKINPPAMSFCPDTATYQNLRDDDWYIENITSIAIEIRNSATDHKKALGWEKIKRVQDNMIEVDLQIGLKENHVVDL